MKLKHIFLISLFLFILVAGCIEQGRADTGRITEIYNDGNVGGWTLYHDNVNNVTIYYSNMHGALAVIPDYELKKPANYTGV